MSSWSYKRKVLYGGGFSLFVFIAVLIPLYYFFYRPPTCFDGLKNGDETGFDCGGSCSKLCQSESIDPIISWARVFKVSPGNYNVAAYVQNVNAGAGAPYAPYKFKIYDKNGTVVYERSGSTYIPPGKTFVVFESGVALGAGSLARTSFEFIGPLKWIKLNWSEPKMGIENKILSQTETKPVLSAGVVNSSISAIDKIEAVSIIYDSDGNAAGASRTFIDSLPAKSTKNIYFTWPEPFEVRISVCQNNTDTMLVIDRSGSMSDDGKNPPQPLTDVKNAATAFIKQLSKNDRAGLVSFATEASVPADSGLTSDFSSLAQKIQNVEIREGIIQNTNIADGLTKAYNELIKPTEGVIGKYIVLLTDGAPTNPEKAGDEKYPETSALAAADTVKKGGGVIYAIGLGSKVNGDFLKKISSSPANYYAATSSQALREIYLKIATSICKKGPAVTEIITRVNPFYKPLEVK